MGSWFSLLFFTSEPGEGREFRDRLQAGGIVPAASLDRSGIRGWVAIRDATLPLTRTETRYGRDVHPTGMVGVDSPNSVHVHRVDEFPRAVPVSVSPAWPDVRGVLRKEAPDFPLAD